MTPTLPLTPNRPPSPLPDGLPILTVGRHRRPTDGACLMEYVSVLAGARFSDSPQCTDPALRVLAQRVNDNTSDAGRSRLALLAPRLIEPDRGFHDPRRSTAVVFVAATAGLEVVPSNYLLQRVQRRAIHRLEVPVSTHPWRYGLSMAVNTLLSYLHALDETERDRCLHAVLEYAVDHSRDVVAGTDRLPREGQVRRVALTR